jgi:hypothetical protein
MRTEAALPDAATAAVDWNDAKTDTAPAIGELTEQAQASFVLEYLHHVNNVDDSWDGVEAFVRGFENTLELAMSDNLRLHPDPRKRSRALSPEALDLLAELKQTQPERFKNSPSSLPKSEELPSSPTTDKSVK